MVYSRSKGFLCLKYFISSFAIIQLISSLLVWTQLDEYCSVISSNLTEAGNEAAVRNTIIATLIITDLFTIIGIIGVMKESYCMTITYSVFMTIDAITTIGIALRIPSYTLASMLTILVVILSYTYAHRIRFDELTQTNLPFIDSQINSPEQVIVSSDKPFSPHCSQFANFPERPPPYKE
jgi:hypothetical protein